MTKAAHGCTLSQDAVIDTRPARIPFVNAEKLYLKLVFPPSFYSRAKVTRPAEDGEIIEFIIARDAATPLSPTLPKLEPPLKRSHPTQRMRVPNTTCCGLCELKELSESLVS
jgi:hypothetical protein